MPTPGRTYNLFTKSAGLGAEIGPEGPHQMAMNVNGSAIAQVTDLDGGNWTLQIQGKLFEDGNYADMAEVTSGDVNGSGSAFVEFRMMPHLRVNLSANADVGGAGDIIVDVMN
jgi:hypothetical protein